MNHDAFHGSIILIIVEEGHKHQPYKLLTIYYNNGAHDCHSHVRTAPLLGIIAELRAIASASSSGPALLVPLYIKN